jgi:hypothetical protein
VDGDHHVAPTIGTFCTGVRLASSNAPEIVMTSPAMIDTVTPGRESAPLQPGEL